MSVLECVSVYVCVSMYVCVMDLVVNVHVVCFVYGAGLLFMSHLPTLPQTCSTITTLDE